MMMVTGCLVSITGHVAGSSGCLVLVANFISSVPMTWFKVQMCCVLMLFCFFTCVVSTSVINI